MQPPSSQGFRTILEDRAGDAGLTLTATELDSLTDFYSLVLKWNRSLNLTTLTAPEEFAFRHLIEPLFAVWYLMESITGLWDLGSGMGVPGLPIAVVRPDLKVRLIEAKLKKSIFLREAAGTLNLKNVEVLNRRIEEMEPAGGEICLTARAVEEMARLIPEVFRLGGDQLLLFVGGSLVDQIARQEREGWRVEHHKLPGSHSRYLVDLRRIPE